MMQLITCVRQCSRVNIFIFIIPNQWRTQRTQDFFLVVGLGGRSVIINRLYYITRKSHNNNYCRISIEKNLYLKQ